MEIDTLFLWMSINAPSLAFFYAAPNDVWSLSRIDFVGHPVDVCGSHAVIRVALRCEAILLYRGGWEGTM